MTEEIIIDGVDVSECCFYNNSKCDNPNGMACNCINNAVCYFKELKRLKQENFALTQESQQKPQTICELEQENKELLEARNHFMGVNLKYFNALEEINLILDELKQQYDYMTDYSEIKEIQDKINEVLK